MLCQLACVYSRRTWYPRWKVGNSRSPPQTCLDRALLRQPAGNYVYTFNIYSKPRDQHLQQTQGSTFTGNPGINIYSKPRDQHLQETQGSTFTVNPGMNIYRKPRDEHIPELFALEFSVKVVAGVFLVTFCGKDLVLEWTMLCQVRFGSGM